jgi:Fe2+ transport system protein FeoA
VAVHDGHESTRRLGELGLRPGALVEVLGTARRDPLLLSIGDARLAVGRELAELVGVELLPADRGRRRVRRRRRRGRADGIGHP